jgi:hypothetical protein
VNIEINILKHKLKQSKEFVEVVQMKGWTVLDQNITMDKLAASMHSAYSRNKAAVQAVAKKGTPGPVKAKVHATRTKTMMLVFLTRSGWCTPTMSPRAILSMGISLLEP